MALSITYPYDFDDDCEIEVYDDEEEYERLIGRPAKPTAQLYLPKRRAWNNDDSDDFVAIDFETMTSQRTSACALGMVKVIDGEIVQQYYSLINPVRDDDTDREPNINIHGISLATVEKAETFAEIYDCVRAFIGNLPIVCHNAAFDINVFDRLVEYYGLPDPQFNKIIDTYTMTGKSISACCKEYGIKEEGHHNALWDAHTCARIYLELIGKPLINRGGKSVPTKDSSSAINKEHRGRLSDDEIENKDTIFYGAVVVITGVFEAYPDRDELAARLQALGAKVNSSISKKTTHVLVGEGAGPKKIDKIRAMQDEGSTIVMLREHELVKYLKD